jgi:1-deoxy-D-xylulose-5-phosphate synthase
VAIYSTFMQRAYDQIIHDICIQNLPVTFCMDRAGIVGADGATHTGMFDIAFMRSLPNMTIMAPKDEAELRHMLATALTIDGPVAIRYPRGNGYGVEPCEPAALSCSRAELLCEGNDGLAIAVGSRVNDALSAVEALRRDDNRRFSLLNLRFIKPLDADAIRTHLRPGKPLIVIEEGVAMGGIGEQIAALALSDGWSGPFIHIAMPDSFPAHGTQAEILNELGLDAEGIAARLRGL